MHSVAVRHRRRAREALAQEEIGLVILDVLLPDGDGLDLLRDLRASPQQARCR